MKASDQETVFQQFREFLYESSGIYFQDQGKKRLLSHVETRMKAADLSDIDAYLRLLKSSQKELAKFFNQTTVNETYFFREETQFDVWRDKVLPQLFQNRRTEGRNKVTIWSAASSSGEEAYSLAILVKESFPQELTNTNIIGFDINSDVIEKAKNAIYNDYSVRKCSDAQKNTYFRTDENKYRLVPYIKRLVNFDTVNMTDAIALRKLPRPDLILCRNALIYFDKASKEKVLGIFGSLLQPKGYLFLGQTEALFGIAHPFELVHFFKTCAYRHKATGKSELGVGASRASEALRPSAALRGPDSLASKFRR